MIDRNECPMRHENGNCLCMGGFCTSVSDEVCIAMCTAYLSGQIQAMRESIAKSKKQLPRWIPVTERLPDPTPILGKNAVGAVIVQTCNMKAKHPHSRPLRYERRKVRGKLVERWTYMDFTIYHESITHWKPLSDPPEGEDDA